LFLEYSYDDSVRLFDFRKPLVPLIRTNVGGGAWRVKWHPAITRKNDLLVACMHDAFKIVRFDLDGLANEGERRPNSSSDWNIVKRFDAHESLAYGVDWSFDLVTGDHCVQGLETLIASGSFYDHALHLWSG
jgi:diphthamide biosynthesis protein 7